MGCGSHYLVVESLAKNNSCTFERTHLKIENPVSVQNYTQLFTNVLMFTFYNHQFN